jgi:hypothetical protein
LLVKIRVGEPEVYQVLYIGGVFEVGREPYFIVNGTFANGARYAFNGPHIFGYV